MLKLAFVQMKQETVTGVSAQHNCFKPDFVVQPVADTGNLSSARVYLRLSVSNL